MDYGTLIILLALILVIVIERFINKKYKNIELPEIREAQDRIFDPQNNTYSFKTIFEVPGCGEFGSYKEASIGARKCALSKLKENNK